MLGSHITLSCRPVTLPVQLLSHAVCCCHHRAGGQPHTMFWKVAGFAQPSPIEAILDKDSFTLEELLDEDDLIQECKSLNDRLVAYLRLPDTIFKLINYIVIPPEGTAIPEQH